MQPGPQGLGPTSDPHTPLAPELESHDMRTQDPWLDLPPNLF